MVIALFSDAVIFTKDYIKLYYYIDIEIQHSIVLIISTVL